MTIHRTAYDTLACQGFEPVIKRLRERLKELSLSGWGISYQDDITQVRSHQNLIDLPGFSHPLSLSDTGTDRDVVIDVRPYGKLDRNDEYRITNAMGYGSLVARGKLNRVWLGTNALNLLNVSPMAMDLFSGWLSENIQRRFALDVREQYELKILAAIYYLMLFTDERDLDDATKNRIAGQVSKATRIAATDVFKVLDKLGSKAPGDIREFCGLAAPVIESVRLSDLNPSVLFQILGGTWFSSDRELIAVATEHPPSWLSILYTAAGDRSYRRTGIGQLLDRRKRDEVTQFTLSTSKLLASGNAHSTWE